MWDYVIVGSGFGGSVSALRLSEKGYRVLVLEKGRRFAPGDFPRSNWNIRKWLWWPEVGFRGIFKMTFFPHLTVLSGVGVGGGSLVYANTLPVPGDGFFEAESWRALADWKSELRPWYALARKMLGATRNPRVTYPDEVLKQIATDLGIAERHHPVEVGVFFGQPGKAVPDPFFDGEGPERAGCTHCGGCMTGCRFNAKNTLDRNYLYLAERRGAEVRSDTEVTWVAPEGESYELTTLVRKGMRTREEKVVGRNVIFAGGVLGTVPLLLRLRESERGLPKLSSRLGEFVRTNSEVLSGVTAPDRGDCSEGVAITSILQTDEHSHLEPVRYSRGSGLFRFLVLPHAPGRTVGARLAAAAKIVLRAPRRALRSLLVRDFAASSFILLYMRSTEGHFRMRLGRTWRSLFRRRATTELAAGEAPQAFIPEAFSLIDHAARITEGLPLSMASETLLGIPTTAHILGGCTMGDSVENGVINHRHEVFGYRGLYVIDGSAVSANPGVNPSLTITALAERAMSFIPPKGSEEKAGAKLQ